MERQRYFENALGDFTFEAACGGEIRHLVDLGYTVGQIAERLSYPVSYGRVQQAVWKYLTDTGVVLLEEPGKGVQREAPVFVKEDDKFGKPSFRRVNGNAGEKKEICWKERSFSGKGARELALFLMEECKRNGEEHSYISCSFGCKGQRREQALQGLEERQREYIQGLPWEGKVVYHRLDCRMREITVRLYGMEGHPEGYHDRGRVYGESCYFMETEEKVRISL